MKVQELFLVWHTDNYGERTLEAITDNPEKWLKDDNEERGVDYELDDFFIEETGLAIYEEEA